MKKKLVIRSASAVSLLLAPASFALADACDCIADPYSKNYAYIQKTWYGSKRKWSCQYICVDREQNQFEILGWHEDRYLGSDRGLEGVCDGTIYEPEMSRATLDYVYVLKGAKWFPAKRSESPELRRFAKAHCP